MPLTLKSRTDGPLHKLSSSFKEIFGKLNDPKKTETVTVEKKSGNAISDLTE